MLSDSHKRQQEKKIILLYFFNTFMYVQYDILEYIQILISKAKVLIL